MRRWIVLPVLVLIVACGGGLKFDPMFFAPTESDGVYDFGSAITEEVWLDTEDGERIQAFFVQPQTRSTDGITVLYSHGNAKNIGHFIDRIMHFVDDFGWPVLIYDYRGFGAVEGEPTPTGVRIDGHTAFNYLLSRDDVDPERILAYGFSLGAHVTLSYVTELTGQTPIMVALEAPFASGESLVEDGTRLAIPGKWFFDDPMDNVSRAAALTVPCLIMHGDQDDFVHFSNGVEVYGALQIEPRQFVRVEGAGHRGVPTEIQPSYVDVIRGFLAEVEGS